jgi:hypothetical protein
MKEGDMDREIKWMLEIKYKKFLEKLKKKYRLEGLDVDFRIILKIP